MRKSRFTDSQIMAILKQAEAGLSVRHSQTGQATECCLADQLQRRAAARLARANTEGGVPSADNRRSVYFETVRLTGKLTICGSNLRGSDTMTPSNSFAINKNQLALIILLLFPIQMPFISGSTALHVATGFYIVAATLMLLTMDKFLSMSRGGRTIFLSLILLVVYSFSRTIISFFLGDAGGSTQDFNELIRLYGLIVFFFLGVAIGNTINHYPTKRFLYLGIFLLTYLLVAFIFPPLQFLFYELYVTRGGRFSGLSFGVNYVFAHVIIWLSLLTIFKNKNYHLNSYFIFYSYLILFIWVVLSGSRSSWIAMTLFFTLIFLFSDLKSKMKSLGFFLLFSIVIIGLLNSINIAWLDRSLSRLNELITMIRFIDYTQVPALESRVIEALHRFEIIMQNPLFGYGINRITELGFHTSYLRSLYRYGFVGFVFELLFYVISFYYAWRMRYILFAKYIAGFVLAFLVAGLVSLVWYELRVPYVFCAVVGILSAREFKNRLSGKQGYDPTAVTQNNFYK